LYPYFFGKSTKPPLQQLGKVTLEISKLWKRRSRTRIQPRAELTPYRDFGLDFIPSRTRETDPASFADRSRANFVPSRVNKTPTLLFSVLDRLLLSLSLLFREAGVSSPHPCCSVKPASPLRLEAARAIHQVPLLSPFLLEIDVADCLGLLETDLLNMMPT
jgi:hypothetical protein